ncbi:hypothetical protein [Streptomyces yaizuensis]|uniref:Membrane protein n=1 Tax=Streptomyces yaizuensis TaxID=2989713 RepID=A0ABQ5NSS0_9ACTN|nr:hypothetical protein [Streptomyces sp. YSPA8]GLF93409.1 membrane protein [Streptomyces sp. YSPA8]
MNDTPGWASPGSADDPNADPPRQGQAAEGTGPTSKWADSQPPAAQWSPPHGSGQGTPPTPPGPGWGGHHQQRWAPPLAAKPGVIPLRPLGVGEILDGSISTLRTHWRPVLGITLTVSVIAQLCVIAAERLVRPEPVKIDADPGTEEALRQSVRAARDSLITLVPASVIGLIVTFLTTALLTMVVSRAVLGRRITLAEAWREARPRLAQLLALTFLLPLGAAAVAGVAMAPGLLLDGAGGALLLSLGILGSTPVIIWLLVRFALAPTVLMLERQGVVPALRRSAKLVQGAWWRTFGIILLTMVIVLLVQMVVSLPFGVIGYLVTEGGVSDLMAGRVPDSWPFLLATGIGAVIGSALTYPLSAGVTALLYIDQRIRRESLDIELARASDL